MCFDEPVQYIIVALSNIVYLFVSFWLYKLKFYVPALALLGVAIVSMIFHLDPSSDTTKTFDIVYSNLIMLYIFLYFAPKIKFNKRSIRYIIFTAISFILGAAMFFDSGTDRKSTRYVIMHILWHISTALNVYFIVRAAKVSGFK